MRVLRVLLPSLLGLGIVAPGMGSPLVFAQETKNSTTPDVVSAERVDGLVEQLRSDSRSERRAALSSLLKLGPDVLPLLPQPETIDSASVRQTIRTLRRTLEEQAAKTAIRATTVTLSGTLTVTQIADAIARQTGNGLGLEDVPDRDREQELSVDWEALPFWSAVEQLCERAKLRAVPQPGTTGFRLQTATDPMSTSTSAQSGPLRIAVETLHVKPWPSGEELTLVQLRLSIWNEPRMRGLFFFADAADLELAAGETPLVPFSPEAKWELPIASGQQVEFTPSFLMPTRLKGEPLSLSIRCRVLVAADQRELRFDLTGEAVGRERRAGRAAVTLRSIDRTDDETAIGVTVVYPEGGPVFESHRSPVLHSRASVQVGDQIHPADGFRTELERNGGIAVRYRFQRVFPLEPAVKTASAPTFSYWAPTLLTTLPVSVRLQKLPPSGR